MTASQKNDIIPYAPFVSIALIALLAVVTLTQLLSAWQQITGAEQEKEKLTLSAEGSIEAVPDQATFTVGVVTESKTSETAQEENSTKVNAILEQLRQQGIADEDLQTQQLTLQPKYSYERTSGTSAITGYTARQEIEVVVRDITKAGELYAAAAAFGGNSMGNISYEYSNIEELKQQATKSALRNAKARAEDLATTAGIRLGKLINFTEQSMQTPGYPMRGFALESALDTAIAPTAPDIQPGKEEISTSVSVTYEIL